MNRRGFYRFNPILIVESVLNSLNSFFLGFSVFVFILFPVFTRNMVCHAPFEKEIKVFKKIIRKRKP